MAETPRPQAEPVHSFTLREWAMRGHAFRVKISDDPLLFRTNLPGDILPEEGASYGLPGPTCDESGWPPPNFRDATKEYPDETGDGAWRLANMSDGQMWGCIAFILVGCFLLGFILGAVLS